MYNIVDYINLFWSSPDKNPDVPVVLHSQKTESKTLEDNSDNIVYLISPKDLLNVKLKHVSDVVPSPARNMPHISKFQLNMLNKAQLQSILNVKLKPVIKPIKHTYYPPRHPVLRELLETRSVIF